MVSFAAETMPTEVWERGRALLDGLPAGQGLNIAFEAVDRHVAAGHADRAALRWLRPDGRVGVSSYGELARASSQVAAGLLDLGLRRGDRVALLLPRRPELYAATLGALKAGLVVSPLFPAFGPEPIAQRLRLGDVRALVTTPFLYERRVAPLRQELPSLRHVVTVTDDGQDTSPATISWLQLVAGRPDDLAIAATDPQEPALLHFTSGTTGQPKGALHVHEAVVAHHLTAKLALGLQPGDVFWCTADPGWVTGMSYGVIAPLTCGATVIVDEREFDAHRWCRTLAEQRVNVWYTAPTAIRRLIRAGVEPARTLDLSALRHVASVGEPLDAAAVLWGARALGKPVHDTWWQTETGAIMIANCPGEPPRPGSMGRPLPGIVAAVLAQGDDMRALVTNGHVDVLTKPDVVGELALRAPWPSMFRDYLNQPERYAAAFADGWYLTGDLARIDADGWVWFVGRADDVIKSAGHLFGPFEVESALKQHPAVADAGVFGIPDPLAGEIVAARVVLREGVLADEQVRRSILAETRRRLGPAVAPRDLDFVESLPLTRSGKVMRRVLRATVLGLPVGDLSTMENR